MNITKNQPFSRAVTYDSALPAYAKLLFYTLERLAEVDGCVQATVEHLAQLMGTSARTVMRYTCALEKAEYITVTRAPHNSKIPNTYQLVTASQANVSDSPIAANGKVPLSPVESVACVPERHANPVLALPHSPPDTPQSQTNVCLSVVDIDESIENKQDTYDCPADVPHIEGMTRENMAQLAAQYGLERVRAAVDYACKQTNLYNKPGFVVWAVQGQIAGLDLQSLALEDRKLRYITGKYADFVQW